MWNYLKQFSTTSSLELDFSDRLAIISRVKVAVAEMQNEEMVHLDIKPSNIFINYNKDRIWDSTAKSNFVLADFGLSGDIGSCSKNAGTPGWASPEQMIGKIHQRSDSYALGKLAIMVLFSWDVAWSILTHPKTETELQNEQIVGTDLHLIISTLLQVNLISNI